MLLLTSFVGTPVLIGASAVIAVFVPLKVVVAKPRRNIESFPIEFSSGPVGHAVWKGIAGLLHRLQVDIQLQLRPGCWKFFILIVDSSSPKGFIIHAPVVIGCHERAHSFGIGEHMGDMQWMLLDIYTHVFFPCCNPLNFVYLFMLFSNELEWSL